MVAMDFMMFIVLVFILGTVMGVAVILGEAAVKAFDWWVYRRYMKRRRAREQKRKLGGA